MKDEIIRKINLSSGANVSAYKDEFEFIYGVLWLDGELSENVEKEIEFVENIRVKDRLYLEQLDISPFSFVKKYSDIAFLMAKEHCLSGRAFKLAEKMKSIFSQFLECGYLDSKDRVILKKEISDTILDFKYSGGADRFSSIRMIPFINDSGKG